MAQNRGSRGHRQGRGQNDPQRAITIGTAKSYAYALINQDEKKLNDMTLYTSGSIGASQNNISMFKKCGASKISSVLSNGKKATVLFANDEGLKCVGVFHIVDQGHVLGDWEVFPKA